MATLYWSPGDHWARSILLSMCLVLSRRVLLVSMRAGDCGGKMQVSMLVGSVSRKSLQSGYLCIHLSVCLDLLFLPLQSEVMQQEGLLISTPSTSIALYFQLNCSLSNKYFGTNVKLIHSFNKYALSINYKPCTRGFPGGLVVRTPSFHCKGNRFDP